jgi:hypothetical protein
MGVITREDEKEDDECTAQRNCWSAMMLFRHLLLLALALGGVTRVLGLLEGTVEPLIGHEGARLISYLLFAASGVWLVWELAQAEKTRSD